MHWLLHTLFLGTNTNFAATVLLILIMIPAAATAGLMHWRRKKRYDAAVKGLAELEKQKATAAENKVDSESAP